MRFNSLSRNFETSGFNTTIFAYGQTGSGKTFSMQGVGGGSGEGAGIIPRMNEELFARWGMGHEGGYRQIGGWVHALR